MSDFVIAIPDSVLRDASDLRGKTMKVGEIARAVAVHRVKELVIYRDPTEKVPSSEKKLLITLLRYIETPQYLRKALFPLQKALRFAGLLPPLATPHHPTTSRLASFHDHEIREGLISKKRKNRFYVDIGAEESIQLLGAHNRQKGDRVTVIIDKKNRTAKLVPYDAVDSYWGFQLVDSDNSLGTFLQQVPPCKDELRLATSRTGISLMDFRFELPKRLFFASKIFIAFGSPKIGIPELLAQEGLEVANFFDYCLNMLPWGQGTRTVRVEEALHASLSLLWFLWTQEAQSS